MSFRTCARDEINFVTARARNHDTRNFSKISALMGLRYSARLKNINTRFVRRDRLFVTTFINDVPPACFAIWFLFRNRTRPPAGLRPRSVNDWFGKPTLDVFQVEPTVKIAVDRFQRNNSVRTLRLKTIKQYSRNVNRSPMIDVNLRRECRNYPNNAYPVDFVFTFADRNILKLNRNNKRWRFSELVWLRIVPTRTRSDATTYRNFRAETKRVSNLGRHIRLARTSTANTWNTKKKCLLFDDWLRTISTHTYICIDGSRYFNKKILFFYKTLIIERDPT